MSALALNISKSKNSYCSTLGSEIMEFAGTFNMTFVIVYDQQVMMNLYILSAVITDSQSSLDIFTTYRFLRKKRLMTDINF